MTISDDHAGAGDDTPESTATSRPGGRRTKIVVGVVGLAAVLGAGSYVIADQLIDHRGATTEVGVLAPQHQEAATSSVPASSAAFPVPSSVASASVSAKGSAPPISPEVMASIKSAREKAAKDGVKVTRPLPQIETVPVVGLTRSTVGSLKRGGIVRLVTARSDLTGQQELAWVAGGITKHGDAHCSQTFRLHNNPEPQKKPNLLLCWKTSAKKSVVAIVVDPKGKPSTAKALKELGSRWQSMG